MDMQNQPQALATAHMAINDVAVAAATMPIPGRRGHLHLYVEQTAILCTVHNARDARASLDGELVVGSRLEAQHTDVS